MAMAATLSLPAHANPFISSDAFVSESGVASWYGEAFHGRTTANGEIYDMFAMTAAHKTLPFGTMVLVTNMSNSMQVVVRINDRGPFVAGRIIDLSKAAAVLVGIDISGTARVEIKPAPYGSVAGEFGSLSSAPKAIGTGLKTVFPDSSVSRVSFRLQIGSYRNIANAEAQLVQLSTLGLKAVIERAGAFNRVVLYVSADERAGTESRLSAAGYKNWIVKKL